MSTKQLLFLILLGFVLFTLGLGIGHLITKQAEPAPIIIEKNSS